jgi:hypothetical protein
VTDAPILVLGSGQRCGSTLIQRLLNSHRGVTIWGEHGGHLRDLLAMHDVLKRWERHVSAPERERGEGWTANLLPGPERIDAAARAYVRTLFGPRRRWGFKEVRFGFDVAGALHDLFPALTAIHVTRDPRRVLASLDGWERTEGMDWPRAYTELAIGHWVQVNRSFREAGSQGWVLTVRYEDMVADPPAFVERVAALIGTRPRRLDAAVFDRRISGSGTRRDLRSFDDLPADLRALLDREDVRAEANALGYG